MPLLVSVVTPCLDPGSRIARCIASVSAQEYPHLEHVVVDGGSTDGTIEVLRAAGVRFVSEPDSGQSDAINKGFALASGEVLTWLNADDELLPGAVGRAVEEFERGAGWTYGDIEVAEDERKGVRRAAPVTGIASFDLGNVVPQPGCFTARWALDRVGSVDEDLHLAMDVDLWLRLAAAGIPAAYVQQPFARFELHPASKTATADPFAFAREEAVAFLKHDRLRPAAMGFGRAAVARSRAFGGTVSEELERATEEAQRVDGRLAPRAVRAGAYLETFLVGRPRTLGSLVQPDVWLVPEARRRLLQGGLRMSGRLLRR
jgi:glycosyltransferase involved in cell wall biosynthesis